MARKLEIPGMSLRSSPATLKRASQSLHPPSATPTAAIACQLISLDISRSIQFFILDPIAKQSRNRFPMASTGVNVRFNLCAREENVGNGFNIAETL